MNSASASRGHTQRTLRQLLGDRGLSPRSSLGQCFLTDLNLLDILVDAADLSSSDFVFEVGAGTGSLTQRLADRAGAVLAVEIDPGLYELASANVANSGNLRMLQGDVLKTKNSLNPLVLDACREMADAAGTALTKKVVANLPYVVATPVISLLMLLDDRPWERIVVTIQKELADRLAARPSSKDYGSISVLVQALGEVELLRELPASAFWPRPRVSSAFVQITPRAEKRAAIAHVPTFSSFTRGIMIHRRKVLRVAMRSVCPSASKSDIDGFLGSLAIDLHARAESLAPAEFVRIANELPQEWLRAASER